MPNRKTIKKYYFSVEGETEYWYFKWLEKLINDTDASAYTVSFNCSVEQNPYSHAKKIVITEKTEIYHISDYESHEPIHVQRFLATIENMKKVKSIGKQITYRFGYSNLTFDLWIILHKTDCNGCIFHRDSYYTHINRAYNEQFSCMDDYKHENNFKRCLGKLNLADVKCAVTRAKNIMQHNQDVGYTLYEYKGYKYYKENPSLDIWEAIEKILMQCRLN